MREKKEGSRNEVCVGKRCPLPPVRYRRGSGPTRPSRQHIVSHLSWIVRYLALQAVSRCKDEVTM